MPTDSNSPSMKSQNEPESSKKNKLKDLKGLNDYIKSKPPVNEASLFRMKMDNLLSKRKKRRFKNVKEIFEFMNKYNELIFEGLQKFLKGLFYDDENEVEDDSSINFQSFFSSFSKTSLFLINSILQNKEDYTINDWREYLSKSLVGIKSAYQMKKANTEHYLSKIGGTGFGVTIDEILPKVEAPYLPSLDTSTYKYTLVLDLDETLIHYFQVDDDGKWLIRPYTEKFLAELSQYYEIVIFTAALQNYADWVIDQIDPDNYIKYRLYRQHALPWGSIYIKDLTRIGRDISRMIIVDNVAENFQLQPDNGIYISSWFDDVNDVALLQLMPILIEIVNKNVKDVRSALRIFRDQMIDQISRGISNPILTLD